MAAPRDIFVGRKAEMAELTAALGDAVAGHGRVVMLAGEPGIGKTRTAERLAVDAASRGVVVLWGRCPEERGAPPYWPWSQILAAYTRQRDPEVLLAELGRGAAEVASIVPEILEKVPNLDALPPIADPDAARFRLFDSVARFLARVQENSALLLIFDNLHLCDVASLRLLEYLVLGPSETHVLILGTYRDIELSRRHPLSATLGELSKLPGFRRIALRGLARGDIVTYIEAQARGTPPSDLVDAVLAHTEGNPFFVAEVVRLLEEQGVLSTGMRAQGQALQRIPEGVREAVGRRLDRLPSPANSVLSAASVIGREFEVGQLELLLAELTRDDILQALEACLGAGVVERMTGSGSAYRFTHALIQHAVAAELSSPAKARMHARVADALEASYGPRADAHAAELAYHCAEAELVAGTEKLVHYSILAAEQALAVRAHEEAAEHFQRVLNAKESAPPDMETARCWLGLVRAVSSTTDLDRLVNSIKGAIECCLAVRYVEGVIEAVNWRICIEDAEQVIDATTRSLKIVPPGSPLTIRLLGLRASALALKGQEEAADADLAAATEGALVSPGVLLRREIVDRTARVNHALARWDQVLKLVDRLPEFGIRDADEFPSFAVWAYLATGQPKVGLRAAMATRARAETSADWFVYHAYSRSASRAAHCIGDFEHARAVLPTSPRTLVQVEGLAALAWLNFEQGRREQGISHLAEFMTRWSQSSRPIYEDVSAACALVRICQVASDIAPAAGALDLASTAAARASDGRTFPLLSSMAYSALGCLAVYSGDKSQAQPLYEAILPASGTYLIMGQVAADRLLGQLALLRGNPGLAGQHFEAALDFCRTSGFLPEFAWTSHAFAGMLLGTDQAGTTPRSADLARASVLVDDGLEIANQLNMRPLASCLEDQRARIDSLEGGRVRYPGGLTEREVTVLRLIAAGMSNREIAQRLVVSVHTVNRHVANILGKIGVANRAEAATYAGKHGLLA